MNAVTFGPIASGVTQSPLDTRRLQRQAAALPLGRLAQPQEVTKLGLFFSRPQSSYSTGETIGVDAGTYAA